MRRGVGIAAALALLSGGCISPHQSVMTDTRPTGWKREVVVVFENEDTVSRRDLYLLLRYNENFECDSLPLTVRITTPDTTCFEEPLTLYVPRASHPAPLRDEIVVKYRRNVRFNQAGSYRITFTPARKVRGVEAIGINLEKTK